MRRCGYLSLPSDGKVRYYTNKRRRAMYKGDRINPLCLFGICGWVCGICKNPIDPSLRYPEPMCATIDHIVPLAQGGTHIWANCQPAHKWCNEQKADRLTINDDSGRLVL